MMEAIGGYLSLELPFGNEYHKGAIRLNTGRNCLEYILRVRSYRKVYIPYYTCEAVLEPINKVGVLYEYYHIDVHLEIIDCITLHEGEALLYTNYFGLKDFYVKQLAEKFGSCLIVDNTQAFYSYPLPGIDTIYTCRKFFGVPDGAYLYCDQELDERIEYDYSYDRVEHLVKRIDLIAEDGYKDFRRAEEELSGRPILWMSKLTRRILQSIDYEAVARRRRQNYLILHKALGQNNCFETPLGDEAVPMVYPYLVPLNGLRELLIENKIFVARYWPNVLNWTTSEDFDYLMASQMLPLPIDQRYGEVEMERIIKIITNQ